MVSPAHDAQSDVSPGGVLEALLVPVGLHRHTHRSDRPAERATDRERPSETERERKTERERGTSSDLEVYMQPERSLCQFSTIPTALCL